MHGPTTPPKPLTHKDLRLFVIGAMLPVFMGAMDNTILASALPTIGRDLGDVRNLPWLITVFLLASTACMPLYGKIADIHGRRPTLCVAIVIHLAGSLICALSPSMAVLIFGRIVQGIGAAGLTSIPIVVLGDVAAPKDRGNTRAISPWSTPRPAPAAPRSAASSPTTCTGRRSSGSTSRSRSLR
jgi:MFS family permease